MAKRRYIQIENKNAILELMAEGKEFTRIMMANNAFKDPKTKEIVQMATEKGVSIETVGRKILDRRSKTTSTESIIGFMVDTNDWDIDELIDAIYERGDSPFFIILDHVKYSQNLGAILRSGFAAGVNGVILPQKKHSLINDEVIRISMGASERIPMVQMGLFDAIKRLQKEDIKVLAIHMEGEPYYQQKLDGPVAFIVGAEDVGISAGLLERADGLVSIPMEEGIGSINVSVSAAVLMFEKKRQEEVLAHTKKA